MARPPVVEGDIPNVTADWAWRHYWPVTDSALQRGAWKSSDGGLVLILINVTNEAISGNLEFNGTEYGFAEQATLLVTPRTENGPAVSVEKPCTFALNLEVPAYGAIAYEIRGK